MSVASPPWLAFPTLDSAHVSLNVDGVITQYSLADSSFSSANIGTVHNTLCVSAADAQLTGVLEKTRSVELWMRVERVLPNGAFEQVLPAPQSASFSSPRHQVFKLAAHWALSMDSVGGIPTQARTGEYSYSPAVVNQKNMCSALESGETYRLSFAMPVRYDDSVQQVVRYAELKSAQFTMA